MRASTVEKSYLGKGVGWISPEPEPELELSLPLQPATSRPRLMSLKTPPVAGSKNDSANRRVAFRQYLGVAILRTSQTVICLIRRIGA